MLALLSARPSVSADSPPAASTTLLVSSAMESDPLTLPFARGDIKGPQIFRRLVVGNDGDGRQRPHLQSAFPDPPAVGEPRLRGADGQDVLQDLLRVDPTHTWEIRVGGRSMVPAAIPALAHIRRTASGAAASASCRMISDFVRYHPMSLAVTVPSSPTVRITPEKTSRP